MQQLQSTTGTCSSYRAPLVHVVAIEYHWYMYMLDLPVNCMSMGPWTYSCDIYHTCKQLRVNSSQFTDHYRLIRGLKMVRLIHVLLQLLTSSHDVMHCCIQSSISGHTLQAHKDCPQVSGRGCVHGGWDVCMVGGSCWLLIFYQRALPDMVGHCAPTHPFLLCYPEISQGQERPSTHPHSVTNTQGSCCTPSHPPRPHTHPHTHTHTHSILMRLHH